MKFLNKMANWLLQKSDLIQKQSDSLPLAIPGGAMQFGLGDRSNDEELLKSYHTWVFRAIRIIAENVAKQKTFLFLNRNNERERIDQHPFLDLLKEVNPIMTKYDLWELTMTYLELTGNAYWLKVRNRLGVVSELWPVRPDLIKPVPDKQEILKGYIWQFRGKKIAYERNDIIHIKYPNPLSIYTGMGTLKAAAFVYDSDLFMRRWHINTFKNQARPDGVLETDQYLGSEDMQRMRVEWQKVYGSEKNNHKMAILQAGIKYKQLSLTPQELDWLLSIKASKIDIFEMFGVPRAIAGIIEDVNRANAEAAEVGFAKNTIHPKLCKIAEKINQDLIPEFDENLEFEFENPVPEDKEFKLKQRESNLKNFVTDINEERVSQGREPVDWGEGPWMPFNLVQFGGTDPVDNASKNKDANGTFAVLFNEDFRLAAWKRVDEVAR
ncbi:MAG: phage portal protein, partial [bacterium]